MRREFGCCGWRRIVEGVDENEAHEVYIENMKADTQYKLGLLKYEPWKVVITAMGAGAALTLAILALLTYLHR